MTDKLHLSRLEASDQLPFPSAVRVKDYVYTSSIYPLDDSGKVVETTPSLGLAGPSEIYAQAAQCFERLSKVLRDIGSSIDLVLKIDVHLASSSDFYEFNVAWKKYFSKAPPARTVIEVGATFPFPKVLLNIDAIALTSASKVGRQSLTDPAGPSSLDVEWAPDAIRAGNFVFCSGFPATDFRTGLAVGKAKGFPNYGSTAEMQASYVFDRLDRVLAQAGTSVEQTVETQLYEPNLLDFNDTDKVWGARMPIPPTRSSIGIKGLVVPGATFVPNLTVLVPDDAHQKRESRKGLNWHPDSRKVNYSPTIAVGDWRFFSGQVASADWHTTLLAPAGLPNHFSSIEMQTRLTLDLLTKQLEANETDWAHCFHARVYLTEPLRDYRGFLRVWTEYFPDPAKAPTVAYVPSRAMMFDGPLIEIDPSCVAKYDC